MHRPCYQHRAANQVQGLKVTDNVPRSDWLMLDASGNDANTALSGLCVVEP